MYESTVLWLSRTGMSAWLNSLECCYHWMTWPSWIPWTWGRQNTPPSAKCLHCSEVSLSHSFPSTGMPCLDLLDHRAMTPAKLKLSPSEIGTSTAREELPPVCTEDLFPVLRKSFMEVWTLPFWITTAKTAFKCWLTRKPCVYYSSFLLVQRQLCIRASSAPGGPGPPPKCSESPSPSLLPPPQPAEPGEQQIPPGQVIVLHPKLSAAGNTQPRVSRSPASWDMDPAGWRLRESPQLLLHQLGAPGAQCGGLGTGGSSFITPGVAAGSIPPPGITEILQDASELHGKKQFPGCDTAAHPEFTWHKHAAVIPVCTGCHRFLLEAGAVHPTDMAFVAVERRSLHPAGWIEFTGRTACHGACGAHGSWGQGVAGAFGELLWMQSNASSLQGAASTPGQPAQPCSPQNMGRPLEGWADKTQCEETLAKWRSWEEVSNGNKISFCLALPLHLFAMGK